MSTVPQWNADIITPDVEASAEIISGGGLEKDQAGAIGVKVDETTIVINQDGALEAAPGGGTTYTAGAGIDINSNVISVSHDSTLDNEYPTMSYTATQLTNDDDPSHFAYFDTNNASGLTAALNSYYKPSDFSIRLSTYRFYDDTLSSQLNVNAYVVVSGDPNFNNFAVFPTPLNAVFDNGYSCWVNMDTEIIVQVPVYSVPWLDVGSPAYGSMRYISIGFGTSPTSVVTSSLGKTKTSRATYTDVTFVYPDTAENPVVLSVSNPVPASTSSDSGKVLTVNAWGTPAWAAPGGGSTYTAGNMISLANDEIAVSTTAGITDIQQVASLPASPVSTVLYLIPES